jgi:hypothetical protein
MGKENLMNFMNFILQLYQVIDGNFRCNKDLFDPTRGQIIMIY